MLNRQALKIVKTYMMVMSRFHYIYYSIHLYIRPLFELYNYIFEMSFPLMDVNRDE